MEIIKAYSPGYYFCNGIVKGKSYSGCGEGQTEALEDCFKKVMWQIEPESLEVLKNRKNWLSRLFTSKPTVTK